MPPLDGDYFFGDYCTGTNRTLARNEFVAWETSFLMLSDAAITSFAQDMAGELYMLDQGGWIYTLVSGST